MKVCLSASGSSTLLDTIFLQSHHCSAKMSESISKTLKNLF
ncbi:hypothetical protein MNB_SV-6-1022 [hydrothermal vent metagenome]|uniref:Uncharacterized protein n=1 Tax=hydrothermal vent metagenome TaxID=652676 RepID=A0A1W1C7E3_9ZZZZ